jgi:hypothetical protein
MNTSINITPFENCPALDGYHCQTNSLAKIFHYHNHPLSEDMIFGLGAGMGFIYWKMKMGSGTYVFLGGRGNNKGFFADVAKRTGAKIRAVSTGSAKKAETSLLLKLEKKEPVMLFGDMGFLPWFHFPQEYHFGGHTFVVCGYDAENAAVLASDMDQSASGLKKGFYAPITLEQLRKARGSGFKPFPPKNTYLEFDFSTYHQPEARDIYPAIKQTVEAQMNPPIKNMGVKGIRHASQELLKWPKMFREHELRMNLFNVYIFFEIGGTGGGCFRYMYSRFLKESARITRDSRLSKLAKSIEKSGGMFSEIGLLFRDSEKAKDLDQRIGKASSLLHTIAELEENTYSELSRSVK